MKRNYIEEIIERNGRKQSSPDCINSTLARIQSISELADHLHIIRSERSYQEEGALINNISELPFFEYETAKYIPIGLISCVETYFKETYARIINSSLEFKSNASDLDVRFSLKNVVDLEKNDLSVGEFISHLLGVNNLVEINKYMSTIIGCDFLKELRKWRAIEDKQLTIFSISDEVKDSALISGIEEVFSYRHQFCHESASVGMENMNSVLGGINVIAEFLWVTEQFVSHTLGEST